MTHTQIKQRLMIVVFATTALLLSACIAPVEGGDASSDSAPVEEVTVTHPQGETTVAKNPERVVVLNYSALDTLDQLGIPVVGVPQGPLMPAHLETYNGDEYTNVGSFFEPDYEAINALDPDLIIVGLRSAETYPEMSEIAPTIDVTVDTANYMQSLADYVTNVGIIFDKEEEVAERLAAIEEHVADVRSQAEASGLRGLIILTTGGEVSGYGPGSRYGMIHDLLGVAPVTDAMVAETHGDAISFEYILEQNPDILFTLDRDSAIGEEAESAAQILDNELIAATNAGANDNIVYLNSQLWYLANAGLYTFDEMLNDVASGLE